MAGPLLDLWKLVLVVEIFEEDVKFDVREGTSKNGKPWKSQNQRGYFKKPGSRFPMEFVFSVPEGHKPYPAGVYFVDPDSFDQGDYDSLELSRFDFALVPVPADMVKQLDDVAKAKLARVA